MSANSDNSSQSKQLTLGIGLLLLFVLIYMIPLGNRPLSIPDETRYAEIPYEMLTSGDWITPRLNGLRYFEKPPLGYWLNAISISVFGENNFAVRFFSALSAGLTTLLVYLFTAKISISRRTALLAAFIHMTFFEVYAVGSFSVLDNLLTLFLTAGILGFYLAVNEENKSKNENKTAWIYWLASGVSLGLAFLTKGFLALAIPVIVMVPWLIWQHQWRALLVKGWLVVLIAVLIVLPWGIAIHLQESDFWHYFFWVEHIKRFTAENAQHKAPFYYFLVLLPVLAFPWFSLIPAAFAGLKQNENSPETFRFLWLWLIAPFLFFSASSGKLLTYILPCFPPMAILMAIGLSRYLQKKDVHLFRWGVLLNLLFLCLSVTAIIIIQLFNLKFTLYHADEMAKLLILLAAFFIAIAGGVIAYRSNSANIRLLSVGLMALPVLTLMQFAIPDIIKQSKSPEIFINEIKPSIDKNTVIISDSAMLRALGWYLKRSDIYVIGKGEVAYGLSYPDASHRFLDAQRFSAMLKNKGTHTAVLFCRKSCPEKIMALLPVDAKKRQYGKFLSWSIN